MVIGILSDTHGYFHPSLPEVLRGVDLILHAGDVGRPEILQALQLIAPIRAVHGNVDGLEIRRVAPRDQSFEVHGLSVWMTHIGGHPRRWDRSVRQRLYNNPPHIFICGHSHILRIERVKELGQMLYLNPGAAGREGFHQVKTCVKLVVDQGIAKKADVVHLDD